MVTQAEYHARLLPILTERLTPHVDALTAASPDASFSIADLSLRIGGTLELLERQHYGASTHIQGLMAGERPASWDGHGELAFLLYYLHNPPPALRAEIDALPPLRAVWDSMAAVAAPSPFTPASFAALAASLPTQQTVKCNYWGDVYGTGTYEQLDLGWAWTLKNDAMNHLPKWVGKGYGIADFVKHDWKQPIDLQPGGDGKVRIAIIGDWGSGSYRLSGLANPHGPAYAVMDTLAQLDPPPDYLIHLGDTYYSGTDANRSPVGEESHNLIAVLKQHPTLARQGHCFTLNSNHEMYGGAWGYYCVALADPLFSTQKGCSYFMLTFGDWILAGIDSAYYDPSSLYMEGGLGSSSDPQYRFLRQLHALQKSGRKVILFSHHTGIGTDGRSASKYLWKDVTGVLKPDIWYWGHTHLGAVYNDKAFSKNMKTLCIGHASMPFAIPPGMQYCRQNVAWYSDTPLDPGSQLQAMYYSSPRAKNGFAILTLDRDDLAEAAYDIGSTVPVWSSQT